MRKRLLLAVIVVVLNVGCAEDPKRPPITDSPPSPIGAAGGGGIPTDGGVLDAAGQDGGDAGSCTDLAVSGGVIAQQVQNLDQPAGTGGTILDGTYDLIDATFYGGAAAQPGLSGAEYQGSIRITGAAIERHTIFKSAGGATAETFARGTLVTAGSPTINLTCPSPAQELISYTVNGNNLIISNLSTKESLGFTRKP